METVAMLVVALVITHVFMFCLGVVLHTWATNGEKAIVEYTKKIEQSLLDAERRTKAHVAATVERAIGDVKGEPAAVIGRLAKDLNKVGAAIGIKAGDAQKPKE